MAQTLTLEQSNNMIKAAFAKGKELELAPLTVAVLDAGGHLIALQRDDGATFLRPQIAFGKAWSSLALGIASRKLFGMGEEQPMFMNSLINLSDQKLIPVPGGVLIKNSDGEVLGAIGITGGTSDNDEACAVAAVEAVNMIADCGR